MNSYHLRSWIILLLFGASFMGVKAPYACEYWSEGDGDWTSITWSNDGSSCDTYPPFKTAGDNDTIHVLHKVELTNDDDLFEFGSNTQLIVEAGGELKIHKGIKGEGSDGSISVSGVLAVKNGDITIPGGGIDFNGGVFSSCNGSFLAKDGAGDITGTGWVSLEDGTISNDAPVTWSSAVLACANDGISTNNGEPTANCDPFPDGAYMEDMCYDNTVPVTLASFSSEQTGDELTVRWSTATETGNIGFNLYGRGDNGWQRLNEELIPSHVVDSVVVQNYEARFDLAGQAYSTLRIVDVDRRGREKGHGPFKIGQKTRMTTQSRFSGHRAMRSFSSQAMEAPGLERIDWEAIKAERKLTKKRKRAGKRKALKKAAAHSSLQGAVAIISIDRDGLYRVSHEELLAEGVDLTGVSKRDLALTSGDQKVPVWIGGVRKRFGSGGYLEFWGEAVDSLYTHTRLYELRVDSQLAQRPRVNRRSVGKNPEYEDWYSEQLLIDNNREYSFASPNGDPWYDTRMLVYTTEKSWVAELKLDNLVENAGSPQLLLGMYGGTDWPDADPDHHVRVLFNGEEVADELFNGLLDIPLIIDLRSDQLQPNNSLELVMPGDTGVDFDLINLDTYGVVYPRTFVARKGALHFTASGSAFRVSGFGSENVIAYRKGAKGKLVRLNGIRMKQTADEYTALIPGHRKTSEYFVAEVDSIRVNEIARATLQSELLTGQVDYLMISHGTFIDGLAELVTEREAEGYLVGIVDVEDVYRQYGDGAAVDPQAIRKFIKLAAGNHGTRFVLLVGGDSYDYFDYTGAGSISFIPSLYAATDVAIVKFAPSDPLYTDIDDDNVPDLAIGRFPVRTAEELASIIDKTLSYGEAVNQNKAVFAADKGFAGSSDSILTGIVGSWDTSRAYIEDPALGFDGARNLLLSEMNQGVRLASYFGHSGPTVWNFDGLFTAGDASGLENSGFPMVVTQWGCWNTYHVEPTYNTMGHKLLLSGDRGAAAVLGSSTLSQASSDRLLGEKMIRNITDWGKPVGQALLEAKQQLAAEHPGLLDVQLGFTLLGDPAIVVAP